jgi:hypothetical protein
MQHVPATVHVGTTMAATVVLVVVFHQGVDAALIYPRETKRVLQ